MHVTQRRLTTKASPDDTARQVAALVEREGAAAFALPPRRGRHATRAAHLLVERLPRHDIQVCQVGDTKYLTAAPKGETLTWNGEADGV